MAKTQSINILSWNILYDHRPHSKALSQAKRLKGLAAPILETGFTFDLAVFYEVEGSAHNNHGEELARQIGLPYTFWAPYGRPNEGIVVASRTPDISVDFIPLPSSSNQRTAARIQMGKFTLLATHLIYQPNRIKLRQQQMAAGLEGIGAASPAIVMGDFNASHYFKTRRQLVKAGFSSALEALQYPTTNPTPNYRTNYFGKFAWLFGRGASIDDIYTRGSIVEQFGFIDGASDHLGIWAMITPEHTT